MISRKSPLFSAKRASGEGAAVNQTQLRYFVSAAETLNFTKTAERYFITQTAITQHVRALEDSLGCALFDRSTRPIRLTPAGRAFYADAVAILSRMDAAAGHVREIEQGAAGTLRVGFLRGYERSDLSGTVRRYHRAHPGVFITFERQSSDRLAAGLLSDAYDVIFTWDSTELYKKEEIASAPMEKVRLVVALYAGHPLSHRLTLSWADLKGEPLLYMSPSEDPDTGGDALFMSLYRAAGYDPDIIFRTSDLETILMMVSSEQGVSILPDYFTNKMIGADNLIFIPLTGEAEHEEMTALWKKQNLNPALPSFVRELGPR